MYKSWDSAIVHIEYCQACDTHRWCTHHDQSKYLSYFNKLTKFIGKHFEGIQVVGNQVPQQLVPVQGHSNKYYDSKTKKYINYPAVGAFEVMYGDKLLFSKKKTNNWPDFTDIKHKIAQARGESLPQIQDNLNNNIRNSSDQDSRSEQQVNAYQDSITDKDTVTFTTNGLIENQDKRTTFYDKPKQMKNFTLTDHFKIYKMRKHEQDIQTANQKRHQKSQPSIKMKIMEKAKQKNSQTQRKADDKFYFKGQVPSFLKQRAYIKQEKGKKQMIINLDSIEEETFIEEQVPRRQSQRVKSKQVMKKWDEQLNFLQHKFRKVQSSLSKIKQKNKEFDTVLHLQTEWNNRMNNKSSNKDTGDNHDYNQILSKTWRQDSNHSPEASRAVRHADLPPKLTKIDKYIYSSPAQKNKKLHQIYGEWKIIKKENMAQPKYFFVKPTQHHREDQQQQRSKKKTFKKQGNFFERHSKHSSVDELESCQLPFIPKNKNSVQTMRQVENRLKDNINLLKIDKGQNCNSRMQTAEKKRIPIDIKRPKLVRYGSSSDQQNTSQNKLRPFQSTFREEDSHSMRASTKKQFYSNSKNKQQQKMSYIIKQNENHKQSQHQKQKSNVNNKMFIPTNLTVDLQRKQKHGRKQDQIQSEVTSTRTEKKQNFVARVHNLKQIQNQVDKKQNEKDKDNILRQKNNIARFKIQKFRLSQQLKQKAQENQNLDQNKRQTLQQKQVQQMSKQQNQITEIMKQNHFSDQNQQKEQQLQRNDSQIGQQDGCQSQDEHQSQSDLNNNQQDQNNKQNDFENNKEDSLQYCSLRKTAQIQKQNDKQQIISQEQNDSIIKQQQTEKEPKLIQSSQIQIHKSMKKQAIYKQVIKQKQDRKVNQQQQTNIQKQMKSQNHQIINSNTKLKQRKKTKQSIIKNSKDNKIHFIKKQQQSNLTKNIQRNSINIQNLPQQNKVKSQTNEARPSIQKQVDHNKDINIQNNNDVVQQQHEKQSYQSEQMQAGILGQELQQQHVSNNNQENNKKQLGQDKQQSSSYNQSSKTIEREAKKDIFEQELYNEKISVSDKQNQMSVDGNLSPQKQGLIKHQIEINKGQIEPSQQYESLKVSNLQNDNNKDHKNDPHKQNNSINIIQAQNNQVSKINKESIKHIQEGKQIRKSNISSQKNSDKSIQTKNEQQKVSNSNRVKQQSIKNIEQQKSIKKIQKYDQKCTKNQQIIKQNAQKQTTQSSKMLNEQKPTQTHQNKGFNKVVEDKQHNKQQVKAEGKQKQQENTNKNVKQKLVKKSNKKVENKQTQKNICSIKQIQNISKKSVNQIESQRSKVEQKSMKVIEREVKQNKNKDVKQQSNKEIVQQNKQQKSIKEVQQISINEHPHVQDHMIISNKKLNEKGQQKSNNDLRSVQNISNNQQQQQEHFIQQSEKSQQKKDQAENQEQRYTHTANQISNQAIQTTNLTEVEQNKKNHHDNQQVEKIKQNKIQSIKKIQQQKCQSQIKDQQNKLENTNKHQSDKHCLQQQQNIQIDNKQHEAIINQLKEQGHQQLQILQQNKQKQQLSSNQIIQKVVQVNSKLQQQQQNLHQHNTEIQNQMKQNKQKSLQISQKHSHKTQIQLQIDQNNKQNHSNQTVQDKIKCQNEKYNQSQKQQKVDISKPDKLNLNQQIVINKQQTINKQIDNSNSNKKDVQMQQFVWYAKYINQEFVINNSKQQVIQTQIKSIKSVKCLQKSNKQYQNMIQQTVKHIPDNNNNITTIQKQPSISHIIQKQHANNSTEQKVYQNVQQNRKDTYQNIDNKQFKQQNNINNQAGHIKHRCKQGDQQHQRQKMKQSSRKVVLQPKNKQQSQHNITKQKSVTKTQSNSQTNKRIQQKSQKEQCIQKIQQQRQNQQQRKQQRKQQQKQVQKQQQKISNTNTEQQNKQFKYQKTDKISQKCENIEDDVNGNNITVRQQQNKQNSKHLIVNNDEQLLKEDQQIIDRTSQQQTKTQDKQLNTHKQAQNNKMETINKQEQQQQQQRHQQEKLNTCIQTNTQKAIYKNINNTAQLQQVFESSKLVKQNQQEQQKVNQNKSDDFKVEKNNGQIKQQAIHDAKISDEKQKIQQIRDSDLLNKQLNNNIQNNQQESSKQLKSHDEQQHQNLNINKIVQNSHKQQQIIVPTQQITQPLNQSHMKKQQSTVNRIYDYDNCTDEGSQDAPLVQKKINSPKIDCSKFNNKSNIKRQTVLQQLKLSNSSKVRHSNSKNVDMIKNQKGENSINISDKINDNNIMDSKLTESFINQGAQAKQQKQILPQSEIPKVEMVSIGIQKYDTSQIGFQISPNSNEYNSNYRNYNADIETPSYFRSSNHRSMYSSSNCEKCDRCEKCEQYQHQGRIIRQMCNQNHVKSVKDHQQQILSQEPSQSEPKAYKPLNTKSKQMQKDLKNVNEESQQNVNRKTQIKTPKQISNITNKNPRIQQAVNQIASINHKKIEQSYKNQKIDESSKERQQESDNLQLKLNSQIKQNQDVNKTQQRAEIVKYLYGLQNERQMIKFNQNNKQMYLQDLPQNVKKQMKSKWKHYSSLNQHQQTNSMFPIECPLLVDLQLQQNNYGSLRTALQIFDSIDPKLITRIFEKCVPDDKIFGIWLCDHFAWKCIIIDAEIPVDSNNRPIGLSVQANSNSMLWLYLLQKALAICLGGYENLQAAEINTIIHMITGANILSYKVREDPERNKKILSSVRGCLDKKFYVSCQRYQSNSSSQSSNIYKLENIKKTSNGEVVLQMSEIGSSQKSKSWIKLDKFVQQFKMIHVMQIKTNNYMNRIQLNSQKGLFSIVSLAFDKQGLGSISVSSSQKQELIKIYLYRQQKESTLKLIGQASEKQKNQMFFDCYFSTGKYYLFVETSQKQSNICFSGEVKPIMQFQQTIRSDGYKNDCTEYLQLSKKSNKENHNSKISLNINKELQLNKRSRVKQNSKLNKQKDMDMQILKQNFIAYLTKQAANNQ